MNTKLDLTLPHTKWTRISILILFCTIYCLISLVNHYNYRTAAFDLGIYNNCLYQYGHFHKNHYPYLHYMFSNFLADHFSLYTVILSPLYYIFGSYTLLYVQILSVLIGAIGIYKVVQLKYNYYYLPEIAMVHFLAFFGIYSAISFDYHDNTVSAMIMPWFFYFFEKRKLKQTIIIAILIIIGKENMPIWLAAISAGLFLLNFKDKSKRNLSFLIGLFSVIYVLVIIKIVMPALDDNMAKNGYNAFKYSVLGNNLHDIIINITQHPLTLINAFYYNHLTQFPELNGIKKELYFCLLFSGGFMCLIKPQYLVMLMPIIAQKVLSDDFGKWGINYHYSIEFAPIIIIAFYDGLSYLKNKKLCLILSVVICVSTGITTLKKIKKRESLYYNSINVDIFKKEHYQSEYKRSNIDKAFSCIPKDANVSALNVFCPHLSFRKNIYQYPDVHDAEYVLLAKTYNSYPVTGIELDKQINNFLISPNWEAVFVKNNLFLFKKK